MQVGTARMAAPQATSPTTSIQPLEKRELTACTLWEAFPSREDSASLAFHCPAWKLRGEGEKINKKKKREKTRPGL